MPVRCNTASRCSATCSTPRARSTIRKQRVRAGGASLYGEFGLTDWLKFRTITAYRKDRSDTPIDFDALPAVDVDVPAIYRNRQFSQEFQLVADKGPLQGVARRSIISNAKAVDAFDVRLYTTCPTARCPAASSRCRVLPPRRAAMSGPRPGRSSATSPTISRRSGASRSAAATPMTSVTRSVPPNLSFGGAAGARRLVRLRRRHAIRRAHLQFRRPPNRQGVHAARLDQLQADAEPQPLPELFEGLQRRRLRPARPDDPGRPTPVAASDDLRLHGVRSGKGRQLRGSAGRRRCSTVGCSSPPRSSTPNTRTCRCRARPAARPAASPTFCGITTNAGKARFRGVEVETNCAPRAGFRDRRATG